MLSKGRAAYICSICLHRYSTQASRHYGRRTLHSTMPADSEFQGPTILQRSTLKTQTPLFASYTQLIPPTAPQLAHAASFFQHPPSPPVHLFSSAQFRSLPPSVVPEVCFLGRSNVGKSSLLNALMHRTSGPGLAFTSAKPGRTRALNAFAVGGDVHAVDQGQQGQRIKSTNTEANQGASGQVNLGGGKKFERWVGRGGLVVLDMPGYGKGSREEWGREVLKYLKARQQYVVIIITGSKGNSILTKCIQTAN
jgi:GTP-binding protein